MQTKHELPTKKKRGWCHFPLVDLISEKEVSKQRCQQARACASSAFTCALFCLKKVTDRRRQKKLRSILAKAAPASTIPTIETVCAARFRQRRQVLKESV
jgi:hypothetical protein